jgi:hypothetical protein
MIYLRVEMWPGGNRERAYVLGEGTITNDGAGDLTTGSYDVALSATSPIGRSAGFGRDPRRVPHKELGDGGVWRRGRVEGYPRASLVMWHLIARALSNAVGGPALRTRKRKATR